MTFLPSITCAMKRCRPSRESYRWDRESYSHVGDCRYCGKAIRRLSHRNWEPV